MGASVSYKLKSSLQGALAAGGDPATSPLYVFGPFLSLIVPAGVAAITFGTSIWMVIATVISVSLMYRYVMIWVTDGSGGSGLCEEEFGSWAVKVNAAITVIEYTLTFLVSIAALVTFAADRIHLISLSIGPVSIRSLIAVVLSVLIAFIVNRGSKASSQLFGPATALILAFLWVMIGVTIWTRGFSLPDFNIQAFSFDNIHFTLGGFARILALMTGIEIFANLVASYEGTARERSRRAFGSLLIVMGTTVTTMLIVGPAILDLSDISNSSKSVFTQTMDALLPPWLSYTGTLIGIAVLLSAAAASAQGIQNLCLGLRARHYIPAKWGTRNKFDVPGFPVWTQVAFVSLCFLVIGTHEETYLALYAAGVFILLSMTGWASTKRFFRLIRSKFNTAFTLGVLFSSLSATLATFATAIIFEERFTEGAWLYLVLVPALFIMFDFYRRRLGLPPESQDKRLEILLSASTIPMPLTTEQAKYAPKKILTPFNGSLSSDIALRNAIDVGKNFGSSITALFVESTQNPIPSTNIETLQDLAEQSSSPDVPVSFMHKKSANLKKEIVSTCENLNFDLICFSARHIKDSNFIFKESLEYSVLYSTTPPVLFYRPTDRPISRKSRFRKILVPLDGSETAEQVLPYAVTFAERYRSQVTLFCVPETQGDSQLVENLQSYLKNIANQHFSSCPDVKIFVEGSGPQRTLKDYAESNEIDLIALVSHGRGGLDRQSFVKIGSVSEGLLLSSDIPILFVSAQRSR